MSRLVGSTKTYATDDDLKKATRAIKLMHPDQKVRIVGWRVMQVKEARGLYAYLLRIGYRAGGELQRYEWALYSEKGNGA